MKKYFIDNEFNTFENWIKNALENDNILCKFTENNKKYIIKIKEV